MTVKLVNNPSIQSTATFTITINPCIVTSFIMTTLSPTYDQSYTIGNSALLWTIIGSSVTTQVPACGYSFTLTHSTTSAIVTATPGATISYSA